MTTKKTGGPAFPQPNHIVDTDRGRVEARDWMEDSGMFLRDFLAGLVAPEWTRIIVERGLGDDVIALLGLKSSDDCFTAAARTAYRQADAMLEERERPRD